MTELLEGETLAARLARTKRPLPLPDALTIATEIAGALNKAHRAGITHRDLKPRAENAINKQKQRRRPQWPGNVS